MQRRIGILCAITIYTSQCANEHQNVHVKSNQRDNLDT